jgi:tRNA threonylcarbamoyladenosine biosynthesis protein TsaE
MSDIMNMNINLPDESATLALGAALAPCACPGWVIWLDGDLGAGKTTLVRGLLRAFGDTGPVKSPTYTLVEIHVISGLNLYHFDFYRFNQPEEYLDAGLDEYFDGNGLCLVEWPDRATPYLPAPDLHIRLTVAGDGRRATLAAGSQRGRECLTNSALLAEMSSAMPPLR